MVANFIKRHQISISRYKYSLKFNSIIYVHVISMNYCNLLQLFSF